MSSVEMFSQQETVEQIFFFFCTRSHSLTHFILNRLSNTIYCKSPISILGMSGYIMYIFLEKKAKLFAKSEDPDQMLSSAVSDLDLHCLPITI